MDRPRNKSTNKVGNSRQQTLQNNLKRKNKYNTDEAFRRQECLRIRKWKQKKKEAISLRVTELSKPATGGKECVPKPLVNTDLRKKGKIGVVKRKTLPNRKESKKKFYLTHGPAIRQKRIIDYHRNLVQKHRILVQKHTLKMKHHLKKLAELRDYTADQQTNRTYSVPRQPHNTQTHLSLNELGGHSVDPNKGVPYLVTPQPPNTQTTLTENASKIHTFTATTTVTSKSLFTASLLEGSAFNEGTAVTTFSSGSSTDSSTPPSPVKIIRKKRTCKKIRECRLTNHRKKFLTQLTLHSLKIQRKYVRSIQELFNRFIMEESVQVMARCWC